MTDVSNPATLAQTSVVAVKPKNIVVCSDGTGNTANKDRGTNVFKLFEALDLTGHLVNPASPKQIAFYDDGVGTESFKPVRVISGAFGWGLSRNVRELYAALVRSYNPQDRIFMFGFSRGAFTVRTLAGFVANCGILNRSIYRRDADLRSAVDHAYKLYRTRYMGVPEKLIRRTMRHRSQQQRDQTLEAEVFAAKYGDFQAQHKPHPAPIAFIGVWDTVDAVGLPFDHLADVLNWFYRFKFSDLNLHARVERACHAIAIDDERHTFHPVMWNETADDKEKKRIKQVWFPGVHSNIGGGYPKQGMSLVSLDWIMTEAADAGLRFNPTDRAWCAEHANINDTLYDSRGGMAVYYRYKPRDIAAICKGANVEPKIHESAIERVRQQTEGYSPGNLPAAMRLVATGSSSSRYPNAARVIANAHAGASSLLDRQRVQVFLRRISHYGFVALSLALATVLIWPQLHSEKGLLDVIKSIFALDGNSLVAGFTLNPVLAGLLLAATAAFFLVQLKIEESLRQRFSEFWLTILGERRPEPPDDVLDESSVGDRPA